jgi:PncC family amidohydrolase
MALDQVAIELARTAGERLRRAGWHVATAESCSGGLVGHLLTEIAGSSAYYQGGVIAYDNAVKRDLLGVNPATLERAGAVSEACAREMAEGARRVVGTEVAVSTTGIAGPGGGSPEKPVGLVYVAVATPGGTWCERYLFEKDRTANKEQAARAALELLLAALDGSS